MKVLIVDDEAAAAEDLATVLNKVLSYAVIKSAFSASKALQMVLKEAFDVALLDIRMPDKDGLALAKEIKEIRPMINIIMVTAYPEYALEAHKLFVSGYLLKPALEEDVREAFSHLRNPVMEKSEGLYVRCFGNFEVFYKGEIVSFKRNRAKEMFAYLIDRRGSSATNAELRAILFGEDAVDAHRTRDHFHHIAADLRDTLNALGCGDVLAWEHNAYAVRPEKIDCDYYRALASDPLSLAQFESEYMNQYRWAESRLGGLIETLRH